MKLSATRLNTYLQCPRQYRYRYVLELPVIPTTPLLFGSCIHETLRFVQEHRVESGNLPLLSQALDVFNRLWQESVSREQPLFKPGTSPKSYEDMAKQMLAVHLKVSRTSAVPLLLEFPFEVTVGEHQLVGILDRVDEGEHGLVVVDYKSGARKPSAREVGADLQLTCYAFAVQQMFDLPVERVAVHHLRDGLDLMSNRAQSDYDWLCHEVIPFVAESVEAERFAPKPGYYCRWCDYKLTCQQEGVEAPESATVAGGVSWLMPCNS